MVLYPLSVLLKCVSVGMDVGLHSSQPEVEWSIIPLAKTTPSPSWGLAPSGTAGHSWRMVTFSSPPWLTKLSSAAKEATMQWRSVPPSERLSRDGDGVCFATHLWCCASQKRPSAGRAGRPGRALYPSSWLHLVFTWPPLKLLRAPMRRRLEGGGIPTQQALQHCVPKGR